MSIFTRLPRRRFIAGVTAWPALTGLPALLGAAAAQALAFPTRPMRYIVPVAAGGGSDLVGWHAGCSGRLCAAAGPERGPDHHGAGHRGVAAGGLARDVVALRRKVVATVDASIDEAAADVTAVLRDGRRVRVRVEHAIGSLQRPMSDAALAGKFNALADPVLGAARTAGLLEAAWAVGHSADLRGLAALARP